MVSAFPGYTSSHRQLNSTSGLCVSNLNVSPVAPETWDSRKAETAFLSETTPNGTARCLSPGLHMLSLPRRTCLTSYTIRPPFLPKKRMSSSLASRPNSAPSFHLQPARRWEGITQPLPSSRALSLSSLLGKHQQHIIDSHLSSFLVSPHRTNIHCLHYFQASHHTLLNAPLHPCSHRHT